MKLSISTTRRETLLGWFYFFIYLFILPTVIDLARSLLGLTLSRSALNIVYDIINFVCIIGIFHTFLWASVKAAWVTWKKCLRSTLQGFGIYYAGTLLVEVIIAPWVGPWFSNVNDETVIALSQEHTGLFIFCSVLLVPIVEETLFRGLAFQGLYRKNPLFALLFSVLLFAAIHLLSYIGRVDWKTLLICFVQYLPAGLALAGAYVMSDTIVTPILMHITVNLIGFIASR